MGDGTSLHNQAQMVAVAVLKNHGRVDAQIWMGGWGSGAASAECHRRRSPPAARGQPGPACTTEHKWLWRPYLKIMVGLTPEFRWAVGVGPGLH